MFKLKSQLNLRKIRKGGEGECRQPSVTHPDCTEEFRESQTGSRELKRSVGYTKRGGRRGDGQEKTTENPLLENAH